MYRYLLFAYDFFYPCGGMDDCVLRTDCKEDLINKINNFKCEKLRYGFSYDLFYIYDTIANKNYSSNSEDEILEMIKNLGEGV